MKLMHDPASLYVRKVRKLALETASMDRVSRNPEERGRNSRPGLAAWYERFAAPPPMGETRPE